MTNDKLQVTNLMEKQGMQFKEIGKAIVALVVFVAASREWV